MNRLSRVLVSGLAVALMASVSLSMVASALGVDYWLQVVQGTNPHTYLDLNDAQTAAAPTSGFPCGNVSGGFYEHVSGQTWPGLTSLCYSASQTQVLLGSPSGGATSMKLVQDPTVSKSRARFGVGGMGSFTTEQTYALMVWSKLDACPIHGTTYGRINLLRGTGNVVTQMPSVYTDDCGKTVTLADWEEGDQSSPIYRFHTFSGPGKQRWFQTALVYVGNPDGLTGTLTYYGGYQGLGQTIYTGTTHAPGYNGTYYGVELGGQGGTEADYPGAFTVEFWGLASWANADAEALLSPPEGNTGNTATWLKILNSIVPFNKVTPGATGMGGEPKPGSDYCENGSPSAPLSHSCGKFQIPYLAIQDCGPPIAAFHVSVIGFEVDIPNPMPLPGWMVCELGNVAIVGVNALIFAANCILDVILPDGSGVADLHESAADVATRFPFGYLGILRQIGAAFGTPSDLGTFACTATVGSGVSTCSFSGGSGALDFSLMGQHISIDLPSMMYPYMHQYLGIMNAVVYATFGIGLVRAIRGDIAGHPE